MKTFLKPERNAEKAGKERRRHELKAQFVELRARDSSPSYLPRQLREAAMRKTSWVALPVVLLVLLGLSGAFPAKEIILNNAPVPR
jgi:hypothetical protein